MLHSTLRAVAAALVFTSAVAAQQFLSCDSSRALYLIDETTGSRFSVGTISSNAGTSAGLAYKPSTDTLYLTSTGNDSLYTVDLATGTATLVGAYGDSQIVMHGLEYDSSTNALYGVSSHNNGLYLIDQATGFATLIGTTGLTSFTNLCYDAGADVLYATNSGTDSFYTIDRQTGLVTLIGPLLGPTNPHGLAYDPRSATIYLVCSNTDRLYTVNKTTGAATAVGDLGSANYLGLAYRSIGGSIARKRHGCGALTLTASGAPSLGGNVSLTLGGVGAGLSFLGFGFVIADTPFCTCTIGHDWAANALGVGAQLALPNAPGLLGVQLGVQGAELFGAGGCVAPQLAVSDTLVLTIG